MKTVPRTYREVNKKYLTPFKFKPTAFPENFCLIVDTREQHSPLFIDKPPKGLMVMRDTLKNGDYGIKGLPNFAIEKKYYGDLFSYCSTEMVEKTIPKMQRFKEIADAGGWVGLVIENKESDIFKWQQYTNIHPESVRGALTSFSLRYGVHVHFAGNRESAGRWILDMASKWYLIQHEL